MPRRARELEERHQLVAHDSARVLRCGRVVLQAEASARTRVEAKLHDR